MLKTDLHLHTSIDAKHRLRHTPKDLIRYAAKLKFKVLSITHHEQVYFNNDLKRFAKKHGILLIPGCEHMIQNKDILIYNITEQERKKINTFEDLDKVKDHSLVIAPHPFYFPNSLGRQLIKHIDRFDAIEFSHFYTKYFSRNKPAVKAAIKYNKPLVGTSDTHSFSQMGYTYTMVDASARKGSVLEAIRKNKLILRTNPLPVSLFFKNLSFLALKDKVKWFIDSKILKNN